MTAQELKNSILQLAVQGKLVPQDSSDEPASELLKRIQTEKSQLINEGKIKKEKALPSITEEEIPFDIPENWEWIRLGDVGSWGSGATPSKSNSAYYNNATIPWLVTGDLNDSVITEIPGKITEKALNETSVKLNPADSVLMAMYGATIGKVGLLTFPATTNQACCACQAFSGINLWYLMYFLMSQRKAFVKRGEGGAQPNISKEKIVVTLMPLPPLTEQQRIVDKIEELLPLVEEYGKAKTRLKELNADFPDMLRKSILQQAVQGKLTERNLEDEPASELLKRINFEKSRLIKEGLYTADKKHTAEPIHDEDIPYDLPDNWQWVRFADIVAFNAGKTPQRQNASYWTNTTLPWVSIADMVGDGITLATKEGVSDVAIRESFSGKISQAGTMIMSFKLTIGKVSILGVDAVHNEAIISIYPFAIGQERKILQDYLFKILPLIAITGDSKNAVKGKTLNSTSISNLLIPLPPLEEQKRIVERVEELLSLCDQLK